MPEEFLRAIFLLAGIEIRCAHKLANGYCGDQCEVCRKNPWWLVETQMGLIKIGWRKRVISIDWSATKIRAIITTDDCTKDESSVHAWGHAKAVEHLTNLRMIAARIEAANA